MKYKQSICLLTHNFIGANFVGDGDGDSAIDVPRPEEERETEVSKKKDLQEQLKVIIITFLL